MAKPVVEVCFILSLMSMGISSFESVDENCPMTSVTYDGIKVNFSKVILLLNREKLHGWSCDFKNTGKF